VQRVTRDVVFVDQRYLVLRDRVVLSTPGRISWLLHAEKDLTWNEEGDYAFIQGKKATLTSLVLAPGVVWNGVVTDEFPVPVDPKYVSGEVGSSYVTAEWSNHSHLAVQSAEAGSDFTIYSVFWPEPSGNAPAELRAQLDSDGLLIQRPDGTQDVIRITDDLLSLK
jgi:hypothetical protein